MSLKNLKNRIARELGNPTWSEQYPLTDSSQAKMLWNGVLEDTGHPLLMHFLAELIEKGKVPARDPIKLARAVQLYSARKIKYFRERPERFQSAMRTIAWGLGDCDDKSRFIAACLRSFRMPVRLKFIRFMTDSGKKGHVYPLVYINKWIPLESVREYEWGYDPQKKAESKGFKVESEIIGDSENA